MSIEMEGFCRGCLIRYDEPTDLLQYTEKNRRLFVYSTGLQVKRNDAFTFQLCKDCYVNMKVSSKFKKQCRSSEKRFKSYLALKQTGNNLDFCTFLKNDDTWSLRLHLPNGNSTPAYQKVREDDNDSTCTSIRNFMTDILQAEEIPDTEARIIREVIEEEADVLDDSLDSHWLQDDVSIDTDFRLDFSFSPFSTPKSVANDHCYTPRKDDIQFLEPSIHTKSKHVYAPRKTNIDLLSEENQETVVFNKYLNGINLHDNAQNNQVTLCKSKQVDYESDWVCEKEIENCKIITNVVDNDFIDKLQDYTIDRNIENALADTSNKEISLEDLLKTPPVHHAPSPSITNILFGDKLDSCSSPKPPQWLENYDDVPGDINILEEFLHCGSKPDLDNPKSDESHRKNNDSDNREFEMEVECEQIKGEVPNSPRPEPDEVNQLSDCAVKTKPKRVPLSALENDLDVDECYCKLCKKKLANLMGLKMHFAKTHRTLIVLQRYKKRICDLCGEEKNMSSSNFKRHRELHFDRLIVECEICNKKLCGLLRLEHHKKQHHRPVPHPEKQTNYVCALCGQKFHKKSAYIVHNKRHFGIKEFTCVECGKQFHTGDDLRKHEIVHSEIRQFACSICPMKFGRRDGLTRHLKTHEGDRYECNMCAKKFDDKHKLRVHVTRQCPTIKPKKSKTWKALEKKNPKKSRKKKNKACTDPLHIEQ